MYCIALSRGFAANGKLGRWKSIARSILNKRDNNDSPTDEEIVAEIVAQNGRDEYEKVLADIRAAKDAKNLSATTREYVENVPDGDTAANLEPATSAGTKATEPSKNAYGEFGNVKMTTAEFEKLVQAEGAERANALIEELSSYLASSGKRYKSHYATLLNWGRRKEKESEPKQRYLTTEEISQRNIEESKRQLDAILAHRESAHG